MSSIPTTFKNTKIPYTVICGQKTNQVSAFGDSYSLLVLNRGNRLFKASVFEELQKLNFNEILSIEGPTGSHDVESLSRQFPKIRFLILHEDITVGEKVNIGVEEAAGKFVFVLWDDLHISGNSISSRLLEKIKDNDILCTVPLLHNSKLESIPSIIAPAFLKRKLKVVSLLPLKDKIPSIYPFDYVGIYNREKFLLVGGFDKGLKNPYWQKLDFGFRSYMWGHQIHCSTSLRLQYQRDPSAEDTSLDNSYKMFFLKNLSIKYSGDSGTLPSGRFFPFYFKSGAGLLSALREFKRVKKWVHINTYRFEQDARRITELWETPDM